MNLIVDVGNSQVKVAVFEKDEVVFSSVIAVNNLRDKVSEIFKSYAGIGHIMISSVGNFDASHLKPLGVFAPVLELTNHSTVPFKSEYGTPKTLGVDRMALVTAAFFKYKKQNCLIVDAGSCITYDFINDIGVYKGGAISPGLHMRYKAMNTFTANLPLIKSFDLNDFIGNSTEQCMISGVVNGSVNEIDATIAQYQKRFKDLTVILTGGDSHFLSKRLKSSIFAHPNFLLEGINYILELNKH